MKIIKKDNTLVIEDVIINATGLKLRCYRITYDLDTTLVTIYDEIFKDKLPRITYYGDPKSNRLFTRDRG